MSQALASPANCCLPCDDVPAEQLVGPQGKSAYQVAVDEGFVGTVTEWLVSLDGANGLDGYSLMTANFIQPAVGATVTVEMLNSSWAALFMDIFQESGGYYQVTGIPDSTHLTIKNRGYTANAAPGATIPAGSRITTAGEKGTAGAAGGGGDMLGANDLSDVASPSASLTNLGGTTVGKAMFEVANPGAIRFVRVDAANTVTLRAASDMRDDLDVVPGTDVQVFDTDLTAIAALVSAANKLPYATGAGTWSLTDLTATARTVLDDSTTAAMLITLGKVLPRQGLLANLTAVDMNVTADTAMGIVATRFRVSVVIVEAATATLATAPCTGGLFKTAGGLNPICADQTLAPCVLPTNFKSLTVAGIGLTDVFIADLIFRVGTPAGFAATANCWVFGEDLS